MLRVAFIGLGNRGSSLLSMVLHSFKGVRVVGVCDSYEDRTKAAEKKVVRKYGSCELATQDYNEILDMKLDAVIIATAWESHIEIALKAMEKGIYVGMEVGGAYDIQDCWDLVDTYERTGTPCMMLENCCYGRYELAILDMVKKGEFGEVVHCAGGYKHELQSEIAGGEGNRHYRLRNYLARNCEQYPTHELGPIAKVLNINRGNRMTYLYSQASKSEGLKHFVGENKEKYPHLVDKEFAQGDIISTIINCENGETITLSLDTTLPRYYSRGFTVRGTKAMYEEEGNVLIREGKLGGLLRFLPFPYWNSGWRYVKKRKNNHPIWQRFLSQGVRGGHGGMDYLVFAAFFESVEAHNGLVPIDAYDTAAWMAVTPLSEISIRDGVRMEVPDFTRGKYKDRQDIYKGAYSLDKE